MDDKAAPVLQEQPVVILTTPRLILRTATEPDIPIMWQRILGDGDVMRYVFHGPMSKEAAEAVMRKFFTFGDSLTGIAILTERPAGDIIGFAGLFPCEALGAQDLEIGFVQLNCRRLLGLADPQNQPSIHALQKLGMRHIKDVVEPGRANRSVFCIDIDAWRARAG